MTFFPDVNVWLALVVAEHTHAAQARNRAEQASDDWLVMSRITHMGLLRLLTNPSVMGGDALTGSQAWRLSDSLLLRENIRFVKEPDDIERSWRDVTPAGRIGPTTGQTPTSLPSRAPQATPWSHSIAASRAIAMFR